MKYVILLSLVLNASASFVGVTQGHNVDPGVGAWYRHLGVNSVR